MRITQTELADLLRGHTGASPVGIVARTRARMRKTDNPFAGRVDKLAHVAGFVGVRYSRAVNRRRAREGRVVDRRGRPFVRTFVAERRRWGRRVRRLDLDAGRLSVCPLVEHRGRLYVTLHRQQILVVEYRDRLCNTSLDPEELAPWLIEDDGTAAARRQEIARPVIYRDYALDSIRQLRLEGEIYDVITTEELADAA